MKKSDEVLSAFLRAVVLRMKELGLNHTSFAKRLKVARPYITKVLNGGVNISFGAACRLAKALEMDFIPVLAAKGAKSGEVRSEK